MVLPPHEVNGVTEKPAVCPTWGGVSLAGLTVTVGRQSSLTVTVTVAELARMPSSTVSMSA